MRTLDGVADDWPLDYATLAPYYAQNDADDGRRGARRAIPLSAETAAAAAGAARRARRTVARGFDSLGWHWWPSDCAIATREHKGRAPCINLGPCTTGCAQGAKASTDLTYWPAAIRRGVRLERGAACAR